MRKAIFLFLVFVWIILHAPHDSLWYDETVNAYLATSSWETIWEWSTKIDNQLPLHFVLLKIWAQFLGRGEFALRLFSFLNMLFAVAGIMALGKRLQANEWLLAIFFVFSGAFLYAAGEVRTYALALALLTWSSVYLWELWKQPKREIFLVYLFLTILLGYTHYTAWFAIAAQFVISVWVLKNRKKWLLACGLGIMVGIVPWLIIMGGRDVNAGTAFEGQVPMGEALETYFSFYVFGQKVFTEAAHRQALYIVGLTMIGAIGWLVKPKREGAIFAWLLILIPLVAMTFSVNQIEAKLSGRHTWVMWIGLPLAISGGIQTLWQIHRWVAGGVTGAALMLLVITHTNQLDEQYGGDFRQAFAILEREANADDLLILQDGTLFTAAEYYQSVIPYVGIPEAKLTDVNHQVQLPEVLQILDLHPKSAPYTIWVLVWQGDTMDPSGLALALPEYLSDGQRKVWLDTTENDVYLVSYHVNDNKTPISEHIQDYAGILQVPPDGPSLLGFDVFKDLSGENCTVIVHTWWWRGETDYPSTMMSVRIVDEDGDKFVQRDLPPAGYRLGQEKWQPYIPTLGRVELPCTQLNYGEYIVNMVVFDTLGEKPEQPVHLDTLIISN